MDQLSDLKKFMASCDRLRKKTSNCSNAQVAFATATTIPEAVTAFRQFWVSVVEQVPHEFIRTMQELYPLFRGDINAAGVYFNEIPADPVNTLVFVGGLDTPPEIDFANGRMRVIVVSKSRITIDGHIQCRCYSEDAEIICKGYSRLTLEAGIAHVYDHSAVSGSGEIHTHGSATARIYGGTLHDHGHYDIRAYNRAIVHSSSRRNITLYDHTQLHIQ